MFALFKMLFRSRHVAPQDPAADPTADPAATSAYSITVIASPAEEARALRDGGEMIAVVATMDQALTLRDTLNLASGARPSRRLLDAIHRGGFAPAPPGKD